MRARESRRQQLPHGARGAAGPRRTRDCAPHAGGARARRGCGAVLAGGRFAGTARLRAAGRGGGRPPRVAISGPRGGQREELAAGGDRSQVDVMGGHVVRNLTFGPLVVEAVRKVTDLPIEAHLMVERPELFIEAFAKSGATLIEVQVEATTSLYRTVELIKEFGAQAGVAINPATPVEALREILPHISLVNAMNEETGFGGRKIIVPTSHKIPPPRGLTPEMEI